MNIYKPSSDRQSKANKTCQRGAGKQRHRSPMFTQIFTKFGWPIREFLDYGSNVSKNAAASAQLRTQNNAAAPRKRNTNIRKKRATNFSRVFFILRSRGFYISPPPHKTRSTEYKCLDPLMTSSFTAVVPVVND